MNSPQLTELLAAAEAVIENVWRIMTFDPEAVRLRSAIDAMKAAREDLKIRQKAAEEAIAPESPMIGQGTGQEFVQAVEKWITQSDPPPPHQNVPSAVVEPKRAILTEYLSGSGTRWEVKYRGESFRFQSERMARLFADWLNQSNPEWPQ